jgi:uncharacterized protein with gpF-like domain
VKQDSAESDLIIELDRLEKEVQESNNDEMLLGIIIYALMSSITDGVYEHNIRYVKMLLNKFISEEVPIDKYNIDNIVRTITNEIRTRSKAKVDSYFDKIRKAFIAYVAGRMTLGAFLKRVETLGVSLTKATAQNLAADIIGTLNSRIQRTLLTTLGLNYYTWNNQGDKRVRGNPNGLYPDRVPDHWIMGGILCRWDNDGVYSVDGGQTWISRTSKMEKEAPGVAYGCRCVGIPVISHILQSIDRSL